MADEENEEEMVVLASLQVPLRPILDASEDILLLWALDQPHIAPPNAFVRQATHSLRLDACGHILTIWQAPSDFNKPGVTGAVLWDSAVILGKFLEHCQDSHKLNLREKRCVELGAGCGFVGCVAALLGADVILTDLPDRLRLLQKNVSENTRQVGSQFSARVQELTWGEELETLFTTPHPDFVFASDVVYNEEAVDELLCTLKWLCGSLSTIILAAELRNDAVLEYFLESSLKAFLVWRVPQSQWHPEFRSQRVAVYVMTKTRSQNRTPLIPQSRGKYTMRSLANTRTWGLGTSHALACIYKCCIAACVQKRNDLNVLKAWSNLLDIRMTVLTHPFTI